MRWSKIVGISVGMLLFASACRSAEDDIARFGPVLSSVEELVGTEVTANRVVSMPCIPSRRDPVGVWLGFQIVAADVNADRFTLDLHETDARLGSHPSGCSNPETLLAQSVFLFDGEQPVFASAQSMRTDVTSLEFTLDGRPPSQFDVVILPTFAFEKGDGVRETTIFGLVGRYSIE